jgi:hypothetical protein
MTPKTFLTGLFLACAIGAASAAPAAGPAADFKIERDYTEKSADGAISIEQYVKLTDDDAMWQFWIRRQDTMTLLNKEPAEYPAGFRFTADKQWLVRMQKTGSGESTLYLYKSGPQGFVPATREPIGDLAWDFFKRRPEWRKVLKPEYHITANLLKGTEENYRWLRVDWPENRYILIALSGDADLKHHQTSATQDWRCRYDLKTGTFDVPPMFAKHDAKAIIPEDPAR